MELTITIQSSEESETTKSIAYVLCKKAMYNYRNIQQAVNNLPSKLLFRVIQKKRNFLSSDPITCIHNQLMLLVTVISAQLN